MRRSDLLALSFAVPAGFFLLSNVFPHLFVVAVFFSAGLAAYLYVLNTVFLYLVAATPALVCAIRKPRFWSVIAACASVLVTIVACVPPLISEQVSFRHAEQMLAGDIDTALSGTPKSIELVGDARQYFGRRTLLDDAPCEELCQRLLLSRQVDLVRVKPDHAARAVHGMDYVLETRPKLCPDAFESGVALLPETRDAILTGTCFVAEEPAPGGPAIAARVEIRKVNFPGPQNLFEDASRVSVRGVQTLQISTAEPGGWSLKLKKTQVTFSHWRMPLFVGMAECGGRDACSMRPVFAPVMRTLNPFEPNELALRTLGVKPLEAKRLTPAARVMAMLDRTGSYFASGEQQLVLDWLKAASCESKPCEPVKGLDEAVLHRLSRDSRTWYFFGQATSKYPGFITANLDRVLEEMAVSGANGPFTRSVGASVARLDGETLRARGNRIMPLIQGNDWNSPRGLTNAAGRLGMDTSALISERLRRPDSAAAGATAACMADLDVGQKLVPALLDDLRSTSTRGSTERIAAAALIRFRHFKDIEEIVRPAWPKLAERYSQRANDPDVANDISICDVE